MKKIILGLVGLLFLSSCNKMVIIEPEAIKYGNNYENKYPVPIKLDGGGVEYHIPRGTLIGRYNSSFTCSPMPSDIHWSSARDFVRDVEFKDMFYEELSLKGYDVVGNPNSLYRRVDDNARAKYKIAAQIRGIRTNVCKKRTPLLRRFKGELGEMEMSVFWQVYSVKSKEVVLELKTTGYTKLDSPNPYGRAILLNESFANAVEVLADNDELQKIIFTRHTEETVKKQEKWPFKSLELPKLSIFEDDMKENTDYVRHASVLIRVGDGHGSGFFISKDGYILTNQHVVGNANEVFIENEFGMNMAAEIIRVHKGRDIALLKLKGDVSGLGIKPLPIRNKQAEIGEDIYAVGSPLYERYKNTLTKGIVSAWRESDYSYTKIQADVDIQGGNSGGPLLDSRGNVIGVAVSGIGVKGEKKSIGMNFFIPISDALNKLNVSFK